MKRNDVYVLALLGVAAALIWIRDLRWTASLPAILPLFAALPLFVWLRRPWQLDARGELHRGTALIGIVLSWAAMQWPSGLLFAAAWTAWLATWINSSFTKPDGASVTPLFVLPLCAFPWVVTDLAAVAGAIVTSMAPWATSLVASADAAFADVDFLTTACVVGGAAGAGAYLRHTKLFWANLPLLIGAVGLAAILQIAIVATAWSLDAGPVVFALTRILAGAFSLVVVLMLCYGVFAAQAEWLARPRLASLSPFAPLPWLQAALLVFGAWAARDLLDAWQTAPAVRFGGLAFVVWLLPLLWPLRRPASRQLSAGMRATLLIVAVACFFVGTAANTAMWHHAGFAVVLISFARRPGAALWAFGALAWMPVTQGVAVRFALDPNLFAVCRMVVATLAAAWGLGVVRHEWAARRSLRPSLPV